MVWLMSSFFIGEERVTTQFSGLVMSYADEPEELNDAFVALFDEALVDAGRRLIADPGDLVAKGDFVCIYHMVIEGTLALTGRSTGG